MLAHTIMCTEDVDLLLFFFNFSNLFPTEYYDTIFFVYNGTAVTQKMLWTMVCTPLPEISWKYQIQSVPCYWVNSFQSHWQTNSATKSKQVLFDVPKKIQISDDRAKSDLLHGQKN